MILENVLSRDLLKARRLYYGRLWYSVESQEWFLLPISTYYCFLCSDGVFVTFSLVLTVATGNK